MAERKAEEEAAAMEKALRERRWRAAGHIQRFWQGYKIRKVSQNEREENSSKRFVVSGTQSEKEEESEERKEGQRQKIDAHRSFFIFIGSKNVFFGSKGE